MSMIPYQECFLILSIRIRKKIFLKFKAMQDLNHHMEFFEDFIIMENELTQFVTCIKGEVRFWN